MKRFFWTPMPVIKLSIHDIHFCFSADCLAVPFCNLWLLKQMVLMKFYCRPMISDTFCWSVNRFFHRPGEEASKQKKQRLWDYASISRQHCWLTAANQFLRGRRAFGWYWPQKWKNVSCIFATNWPFYPPLWSLYVNMEWSISKAIIKIKNI